MLCGGDGNLGTHCSFALRWSQAQARVQAHAAASESIKEVVLAPETDPEAAAAAAEAAGLRYVTDSMPGITRRRAGKASPTAIRKGVIERKELARLRRLAIPPAWTAVWICPHPRGHLQATGRDARGRKQYRYHDEWRQIRDAHKFDRILVFARALPQIRARVDADLRRPGLPRERVLATVVRLLETTLIRVGNAEYARDNKSFGLTTIRHHHVEVNGSTIEFEFRGKGGKMHKVSTGTAVWPASCAPATSCRARSCSSTSTRRANAVTSTPRTSTRTSRRSAASRSPPRISAPGPGPCWLRWR